MDRHARHVLYLETVPPKELVDRGQGEIAEVLVVDGVELAPVDKVPDVGNLDDGDPRIFQDVGHPADHAIQVRDVRQHVVRMEDVSLLPSTAQAAAQLRAEEVAERRNAA